MLTKAELVLALIRETPLTMTQISALFGCTSYTLRKALKEELNFVLPVGQPIQTIYDQCRVDELMCEVQKMLNIDKDTLSELLQKPKSRGLKNNKKAEVFAIKDLKSGTYKSRDNNFEPLSNNTLLFSDEKLARDHVDNNLENTIIDDNNTKLVEVPGDMDVSSFKVVRLDLREKSIV